MGLQEAVCGSRAHRVEQDAVLLAELHMPFLFQGFKNVWQNRDEAFGANPVERLPDQHQCLFNLRAIAPA
jgi:hypothetical protein